MSIISNLDHSDDKINLFSPIWNQTDIAWTDTEDGRDGEKYVLVKPTLKSRVCREASI